MQLEYWFPTTIGIHYVSDECRESTQQKIDEWMESGKHLDYAPNYKGENLNTSYHNHHDTLGDLNLIELKHEILQCASDYTKQMGKDSGPESFKVDSWINFFHPEQCEHQHNHYGNYLSIVYYVTGPKKSGTYKFFDCTPQRVIWKGEYLKNSQPSIHTINDGGYEPEPGKMIIFPSWLEHSVTGNQSNDIRISIANNVNFIK